MDSGKQIALSVLSFLETTGRQHEVSTPRLNLYDIVFTTSNNWMVTDHVFNQNVFIGGTDDLYDIVFTTSNNWMVTDHVFNQNVFIGGTDGLVQFINKLPTIIGVEFCKMPLIGRREERMTVYNISNQPLADRKYRRQTYIPQILVPTLSPRIAIPTSPRQMSPVLGTLPSPR